MAEKLNPLVPVVQSEFTPDEIVKNSIREQASLLGIPGDLLDASFMPRGFVYCNLPYRRLLRSDGTPATHYVQKSKRLTLTIHSADESLGLPFGSMPRMLMAEITQRARQTGSRQIALAEPLSRLFKRWGLTCTGGAKGTITRFRRQLDALCASSVHFAWHWQQEKDGRVIRTVDKISNAPFFTNAIFLREQLELDATKITDGCMFELSEYFFNEITHHPVPIMLDALAELQRSPLAMDLYCFLTHRMSYLGTADFLEWSVLYAQFGGSFSELRIFKPVFIRALGKVLKVYPSLNVELCEGGLILKPSKPHVWRISDYGD